MPKKNRQGIAGVLTGILFIAAGVFFIAFPTSGVIPHYDYDAARYFPEWTSERQSQIYGVLCVICGTGLILFTQWPRRDAQRAAIEDYVWKLARQLARRFGKKSYYSIEEVSRTARESGHKMAYVAYAHAMFCDRPDFDAHYGPLQVACTYDGLREVIARDYFGGSRNFNAATIVRSATPPKERDYTFNESEWGD